MYCFKTVEYRVNEREFNSIALCTPGVITSQRHIHYNQRPHPPPALALVIFRTGAQALTFLTISAAMIPTRHNTLYNMSIQE